MHGAAADDQCDHDSHEHVDLREPALREHLPEPEAAVLWDAEPYANSGYDPERRAPFNRAINVFDGGVPS